jgi:hypothetical protein
MMIVARLTFHNRFFFSSQKAPLNDQTTSSKFRVTLFYIKQIAIAVVFKNIDH